MGTEQFEKFAQNEKGREQAERYHREQKSEHDSDEHPIALARPIRYLNVTLQQVVVALVRSEPESKNRTEDWYDTDELVDENVERHAGQQNFRQPAT